MTTIGIKHLHIIGPSSNLVTFFAELKTVLSAGSFLCVGIKENDDISQGLPYNV